jgi:hypothetical protein
MHRFRLFYACCVPLITGIFAAPAVPAEPTMEWTYHKNETGDRPSDAEQQMVWLMNRARSDPPAEGQWLATTDHPEIATDRDFWNVNTTLLESEFSAPSPKPPAAFDIRLHNAALDHAEYMISTDTQTHDGQLDRVVNIGYPLSDWGGGVFAYAAGAINAHAAMNIDWGDGDDGMQPGRGHRKQVMAMEVDFSNVGIAFVEVTESGKTVGPYVMAANHARVYEDATHFNRFITGTLWTDDDNDDFYDPGEGVPGALVMPDSGDYFAVTGNAGGFAIPVESAGTYVLTFEAPTIPAGTTETVEVGTDSVWMDFTVPPMDLTMEDAHIALSVMAGGNPAGVDLSRIAQVSDAYDPELTLFLLQYYSGSR